MRLLVLSQYFWPESFRVNDLVQELSSRGVDVRVLTGQPNYPKGQFFPGYGFWKPWRENYCGVDVLRVPLWPRRQGGGLNLALNYFSFIASSILFGLPRVGRRVDAVFVFAPSPILQCLSAIAYKFLFGAPVILWVQDLWPESIKAVGAIRSERALKAVEQVVKFIYRHCDLILIQSEAFYANVSSLNPGSAPIEYLPNWAEDLYSTDGVVPLPPRLLPNGFCVLFAGNIGKAQAISTILDAAQVLREEKSLHWVFLGDGAERAAAEQRVRDMGLTAQVHFFGSFPVTDMPAFFAQAGALLVTLKRDEIFASVVPSKVQSYLASGRPVIASLDGEGARIIVESGAGFAGPAEDKAALASNVMAMYKATSEERDRMGRRAREYAQKHFSRRELIDRLQRQLETLARKRKRQ